MFAPTRVRRFRIADLDRIERIEVASFGRDAYERNLFADFYHKCGDLFLVAARENAVCGYMLTCLRGERAEVISIAVAPRARRKGVAAELMKSTLRRLRRRGATRIVLMVKVTNEAARRFYEQYQFRKVRLVRGYYEDGTDGVLMARAVTFRTSDFL